ncbi:MAG: hypothetical protein, partial [Olavius algarvensis Gamma 1 endosymbiont]
AFLLPSQPKLSQKNLVHLRANTDNINPILPLGIILPQRQTRINANGSILTRPYRPFLIDLRLPWR